MRGKLTGRPREIGYDDRGSGAPLVLLHPFPFDRAIWAGVGDALAAHARVIAVDAPGFGESPANQPGGEGGGPHPPLPAPPATTPLGKAELRQRALPFTLADFADDVAALLDQLGVARATVLGMSMGGYTALAFAARHPARLAALVLADTRAAADTPETRRKRDEGIALIRAAGAQAYLASSLARLLSPGAPPALLGHIRIRAEARPASLIAGLEALRDRPDRTAELPAITCPTLVVCGVHDQIIPAAEMQAMSDAIAGARFVALADAGHLSHLEAPGPFETAVAAFVAERGPR